MQVGKRRSLLLHAIVSSLVLIGLAFFSGCSSDLPASAEDAVVSNDRSDEALSEASRGNSTKQNSTFNVPTPETRPDPIVDGTLTQTPVIDLAFPVGGQLIELPLTEGRFVSEDLPAGRLDPIPFREAIENALSVRTRALSEYTSREGELHRQRLRFEAGAIPVDEVEAAKVAYEEAASALRLSEALVENARRDEALSAITGGLQGTVEAVLVEPGSKVRAGQPVYAIRTSEPLLASIKAPDIEIGEIQAIHVRFGETGDWYPAQIQSHEPSPTGLQIEINIDAPSTLVTHLRKEMALVARLSLPPTPHDIRVPFSAVFQKPGEVPHVRLANAGSPAHQEVIIAGADETGVILSSGLTGGEVLILAE